MVIYVDTRQKVGKHDLKHSQLEQLGHTLVRKKLAVGDYMRADEPTISIDTKASVQELYQDVVADLARFRREVSRANDNGVRLTILTESDLLRSERDLPDADIKYGYLSGSELLRRIQRLGLSYGVNFLFCKCEETGYEIARLLSGETR